MDINTRIGAGYRVALLLAVALLVVCNCTGCAAMEDYAEAHPQVIAGGAIVVAAGVGIVVAKSLARSNHVQVTQNPPAARFVCNTPECVR